MRSKFLKRVGALTLSVALFVSAFSVTTFTQTVMGWAQDAWPYNYTDENGVQYGTDEGGLFVSGYKGTGVDVVIPDTYEGKKVIGITNNVFEEKNIESVVIGNNVRWIYSGAFANCKQLSKVQFGEALTYMDRFAFYGCEKLETITVPDTLESMYSSTFEGTGYYNNAENWRGNGLYLDGWLLALKEGTAGYFPIAAGTKRITSGLFSKNGNGTQVTKVGIPASLEADQPRFSGTGSSIRSFAINKDNPYYSYKGGVLYNKDQTKMLEVVKKLPKIYTIPSNVKEIGSYAFPSNCAAKAIVIPKTVERMESGAFAGVVRKVGLLCEVEQRPEGWDQEWAVTEDVTLVDDFPGGNIHYGYHGKAVSGIQSLSLSYGEKKGKTLTFKKGDTWILVDYEPKAGANGYVRWVSSNPSVLKVTQATNYTRGFQLDAPKTGTVWLKAQNSKGKVIAQYKVKVKAK